MTVDRLGHYTQLMQEVVAFSSDHVHNGGIPFTAFVVDQTGTILGRGVNRVREHRDPTAHAEVEAIRNACGTHGAAYLSGTTLMASGEPCALCYMSALYAGISQVFFAVDRDEAAVHGFDYRDAYALLAQDPRIWGTPAVSKLQVSEGLLPFRSFRAAQRTR